MQDRWDSIQNNEYFSFEGVKDVIEQVGKPPLTSHCSGFVPVTIINTLSWWSYISVRILEENVL